MEGFATLAAIKIWTFEQWKNVYDVSDWKNLIILFQDNTIFGPFLASTFLKCFQHIRSFSSDGGSSSILFTSILCNYVVHILVVHDSLAVVLECFLFYFLELYINFMFIIS